jgi:hypothetical protein
MKWKEGSVSEKAPSGSHRARCIALIDLGSQMHTNPVSHETWLQRDVRLMFELPEELMLGTYDEKVKGKPFGVMTTVKQSLHPKANLRKLLEGWRGTAFTPETIASFDPKKLVGLPCRLNLVENGDFVNIQSISRLSAKELKDMPRQVNKGVYFSLEEGEFDPKVLEVMGEKTKEKIKSSPEYKALVGDGPSEPQESQVERDGPAPRDGDDVPF